MLFFKCILNYSLGLEFGFLCYCLRLIVKYCKPLSCASIMLFFHYTIFQMRCPLLIVPLVLNFVYFATVVHNSANYCRFLGCAPVIIFLFYHIISKYIAHNLLYYYYWSWSISLLLWQLNVKYCNLLPCASVKLFFWIILSSKHIANYSLYHCFWTLYILLLLYTIKWQILQIFVLRISNYPFFIISSPNTLRIASCINYFVHYVT